MSGVPPIEQAEEFGARVLAAIKAEEPDYIENGTDSRLQTYMDRDKSHVKRALEGLRACHDRDGARLLDDRDHARRYWSILVDVGALYGVTP